MPGEISLAHHGVLFLDELPEFDRRTLEVIRQPLEDRVVTISRAYRPRVSGVFMLIVAMNPCPCGFRADPRRTAIVAGRRSNATCEISGPLLDRIDIHIEVPAVPFHDCRASDGTTGQNADQ